MFFQGGSNVNGRCWIWFIILAGVLSACSPQVEGPEVVGPASPEAIALSLSTVDPEESLYLFEYDSTAPLDIQEERRWEEDGATWIDFTYASPVGGPGGRVPARLLIPPGAGPFPGMILMHGGPGMLEDMDSFARAFSQYGAVTIMITSPYRRPGGWEITQYMGNTWPIFNHRDLEIKIQLILDLRRAIDILEQRPEVDPDRLAYFGVSWGASMGGLLAGIEDRIVAYVLAAGDGGLVEHTADPGPDGLNIHFSENWAAEMWPTEPLHFVGRAAPAALLFQNGIYDTFVPPHDALRFYTAASEPKTMIWYDAGHGLPWSFVGDAAEWLQPYLGDHLFLVGPNFRPSAVIADRALLAASLLPLVIFAVYTFRRKTFVWTEEWFWLPAILLLGPIGLAIYWMVVASPDDPAQKAARSKWRGALLISIRTAVALIGGLWISEMINQTLLVGVDFRLRFLQSYLAVLVVGWVLLLIGRKRWWILPQAYILVANVFWVVELILPAVFGQYFPGAIWARLPLTITLCILITYPLHSWLLRKGWEMQVDAGEVHPHGESQPQIALSVLLAGSYVLALASMVWIVYHYSGLTWVGSMRFLFGLSS
jgi:dienelactone hydrolase